MVDAEVYGFVYCATASNGKRYIGQALQLVAIADPIRYLFKRYSKYKRAIHNEHFDRALKQHEFTWEILGTYETKEKLDAGEVHFIKLYQTMDSRYGYNKREGGSRGRASFETRMKQSNSMLGFKHSLESIEKLRVASTGPRNANYGKVRSAEHSRKISLATKGLKRSKAYCEWLSQQRRGKPIGVFVHRFDVEKSRRVKIDELQKFLDDGWIRGRKRYVRR